MTDTTARLPGPQTRQVPEQATVSPVTAERPRRQGSPVALASWVLFALGMVLFVAVARVPISAGWRRGRSMPVQEIWRLFTLEVAQVAGPLVTPALVTALILIVLAAALLGLWLAMSVPTDSTVEQPD